jgi:hypothetical protein
MMAQASAAVTVARACPSKRSAFHGAGARGALKAGPVRTPATRATPATAAAADYDYDLVIIGAGVGGHGAAGATAPHPVLRFLRFLN